jgi:NAD(P)-dependent dehydrogenase (short-subunit alcohol dehydrogenase family)
MRFTFRDKVVVVTGGAGDIGRAFAARASEQGAHVVVVDVDQARAVRVAEGLPLPGTAIPGDLTSRSFVEDLVTTVGERFGRIDVLVNNVGMTSSERFDVRSVESIEREIAVNLLSPLVLTRLAIPLLHCSTDPRVVSTVSLGGIFPLGETPIYTASKFGLRGAMLAIGLDLRDKGITAGSVLPSAVDTRMLQEEAIEGGNSLQFQSPPQTPEDVVRALVSILDRPRLEVYPRPSEALLTRVTMLAPNLLPRILPLFRGKGDKGMKTYLESLESRGVVRHDGARWDWVDARRA